MNASSSPDAGSAPPRDAGRLLSLDVMRGLTILGMILVNNPGDWGSIYAPLRHAEWHGWTPTDLVFPFFVFMVGVAMAYSFAKHTSGEGRPTAAVWLRIVRRTVVLIALGLALHGSGAILTRLFGLEPEGGWSTLRWPGVLPRIALAYLGASVIVLTLGRRSRVMAGVLLLAVYTVLLKSLPAAAPLAERMEPDSNIVLAIDEALIGRNHMWSGAVTDPEGLLSTLPAVVSALLGYGVGQRLRAHALTAADAGKLLVGGLLLAAVGQAWGLCPDPLWGMPVNKALWSPSFVLLTAGLGAAVLALCLLVFDLSGKDSAALRRVATAFQMVGVNAIFVFVASGFVGRALGLWPIGDVSTQQWLYSHLFTGPLAAVGANDPRLASLAYAVAFVACWWLVLWGMWRRGWSIRV